MACGGGGEGVLCTVMSLPHQGAASTLSICRRNDNKMPGLADRSSTREELGLLNKDLHEVATPEGSPAS